VIAVCQAIVFAKGYEVDFAVGNAWSQVTVGYSFPAPRSGHCIATLPPLQLPSNVMASQALTASSYPIIVVFGGMNSMYCTSDIWKLRVRKRRSRFYGTLKHHTDTIVAASGADGHMSSAVSLTPLDVDVDSGSDGEDWTEQAPDEDEAEALGDTTHTGILPWKSMQTRHPSGGPPSDVGHSDVAALRAELFEVRKQLIHAREQVAQEVSRRAAVEQDRDSALEKVAELSQALQRLEVAGASERQRLVEEVSCFAPLSTDFPLARVFCVFYVPAVRHESEDRTANR
jgi:hypothetical protein